jgi:D-sedoheptulose 7-phosphate isomerase
MSLPVAVVLAGGFGTRLPEVSATRPKPMADVEGRPFLEYVLEHLRRAGVREVVLAAGYRAEIIERHFGDGRAFGLRVRTIVEPEPLGTGGALRLALPHVGDRALVLNGDTFVDVDVAAMVARHVEERAAATIAAVEREDASRFGRMVVEAGRLAAFEEKRPERAPGLVNAGVYVLERRVLEGVAAGRAVSFEREVLPGLLARDERVAVHVHRGYFEDIGVPETLAAFRAREAGRRAAARTGEVARIRAELEESVAVKRAWSDELCAGIAAAAERVVAALRAGGKVVFLGNGGSAADAQHLAAEFVGKFGRERAPLRAMALHVNTSAVTAIANDWEYDYVFERQVEAWVEARDVVVGLSTSGNSGGVVRALERARALGAFAVALTGEGGGRCAAACDLLLAIPSRSTPRIQESHITAGHLLCGLVEAALAEDA